MSGVVGCAAPPGNSGGSDGGGFFKLGGQIFDRDPFLNPLPTSKPFDLFRSEDVAAGATVELLRATLERNEWLAFRRVGMEILDDPAGTALQGFQDTTWRLLVNGVRHQFYGDIQDQIGRGDRGREIDVRIIEPRSLITFTVTNSGAVALKCFATLQGHTVPLQL